MILNNTPTHEAVLSNVGEIGEFRIRNSAKAFSILSSGLYANKIRAIIRELSCNAVDSHVGAGRNTTPFDVHLPTDLEPWFAIRDYGVGLNHEQVTKIYTTYFESTKTGSNDYIGALGLGSKSPFSYTDNFTVTAIQNGTRGIYSAFINGDGVPSIALMSTETTDQPNGVEVKFSVNERWDYGKFREEAQHVYRYFSLRPVVNVDLNITTDTYSARDIIPGVHEYAERHRNGSIAIMGNIAYPIAVPNAATSLGDLAQLLDCGLEIHFDIGELDFQASREGLSYVPQTIDAIRRKLELVNAALTVRLTAEVEELENMWLRAKLLDGRSRRRLWNAAAQKYVTDTKFPLYTPRSGLYGSYTQFELTNTELRDQYNVVLKSFDVTIVGYNGKIQCSTNGADSIKINDNGEYEKGWKIKSDSDIQFVVNDTNKGVFERAKYHYRTNSTTGVTVYLFEPADRAQPMLADELFKYLMNPPLVSKASTLAEKERKTIGRDVTIMSLQRRDHNYRRNSEDLVWRDAGQSDSFDKNTTFYYLPLNGFVMTSKYGWTNSASQLGYYLKTVGVGGLNRITVYGVRKADIEAIEAKKNWVNLEDHIVATLKQHEASIIDTVLSKSLDGYEFAKYNNASVRVLNYITDRNGKYATLLNKIGTFKKTDMYDTISVRELFKAYHSDIDAHIEAQKKELVEECKACYEHYPLLEMLEHAVGRSTFSASKFASYINLVDSQEKKDELV